MPDLYPWLNESWQQFTRSWERHTHGLLITGPKGVGKRQFAQGYAQARLCERDDIEQKPCGQCRNCTLFLAGTHPDFHVLLSEADTARPDLSLLTNYAIRHPSKSVIGVDQIRALISELSTTAHSSQYKIALIAPAENMNINASNALLKLLEEPPQRTMLLLITEQAFRLPATVRSRCSQFKIACPESTKTISWLKEQFDETSPSNLNEIVRIAGGAPLVAKDMIENDLYPRIQEIMQDAENLLNGQGSPVTIAAHWKKSPGAAESLKWLQQYVADLIHGNFAVDTGARGAKLPGGVEVQQLFAIYDKITQVKGFGDSPLDPTLLLEDILVSIGQIR